MITVISGTNRSGSACLAFAKQYEALLREKTAEEVRLLALEHIPHDWFTEAMYTEQAPSLATLQDEFILPASKLVIVSPEYNGSFPGVLKLFIDACSVRAYSKNFGGKKAALVGVATGRAGNLRGMEHLTGILNYLGTTVMPDKLPISRISALRAENGEVADEATLKVLSEHASQFVDF